MSPRTGGPGDSSEANGYSIPSMPNMCGSMPIVSVASPIQLDTQAQPLTYLDPVFYIPLKAIQAGTGKISKGETHTAGFWTGTLQAGNKSTTVTGYEKGVLNGLVKIPPGDLGKHPAPFRKPVGGD